MRIHIATDHAGLDMSKQLVDDLTGDGHEVTDHGPTSYEPLDDYPSFCINAARAVVRDQRSGETALGVVFGGSGNGEQIAANKVEGVRAATPRSMGCRTAPVSPTPTCSTCRCGRRASSPCTCCRASTWRCGRAC